jgi:hypothetical protein
VAGLEGVEGHERPRNMGVSMTNTIADRAMLVCLNIKGWTGAAKERKVVPEAARAHGAGEGSLKGTKLLVPKDALEPIRKAADAARAYHMSMSLPWGQDGQRILPAKAFFAYTAEMDKLRSQYQAAVRDFVAEYPDHVNRARVMLNGLFDASEYPDPDEIGRRFDFRVKKYPFPDGADFRVDLGDETVARLRDEITQSVNESVQQAVTHLWERLHRGVSHMVERLHAYRRNPESGKLEGNFHGSLVENLRDLVAVLPTLNLTGDPKLDAMAKRVEADLCKFDADSLKEDEAVRRQVANDAADVEAQIAAVLRDMGGYVGE